MWPGSSGRDPDGPGEDRPAASLSFGKALPQVEVHSSAESLALAVADLFAREARRAVEARGRFMVALAGGSTPRRAYELLATAPLVDRVPWEDVHIFWGDERCVAPDDPGSNERMARKSLLDRVPILPEHVHPMRCGGAEAAAGRFGAPPVGTTAQRAADEYERLLRSLFADLDAPGGARASRASEHALGPSFGLDLVLLGLGTDGHTASLFPGAEALRERRRWVVATLGGAGGTNADSGSAQVPWRVTLTAPFINRAAAVAFVVGGSAKAAIVREVLEGAFDPVRLPAQLIRPASGDLRWHLDVDSASLLTRVPVRGARWGYGS